LYTQCYYVQTFIEKKLLLYQVHRERFLAVICHSYEGP